MIHHLMRAVILGAFAYLIVRFFQTGEIVLYIAPRMDLIVKLSALGLYAAAAYQVYAALQKRVHKHEAGCGCGHDHRMSPFKSSVLYGMFILPLLLGFFLPTGTLGSALAEKKGMSFTGSESIGRNYQKPPQPSASSSSEAESGNADNPSDSDASIEKLFPYDEYTVDHAEYGMKLYQEQLIQVPERQFIETLTTLDLYRDAFKGKEVEITGFVYREKHMDSDKIAVSRFAMNCCSADALPYGLMIIWPKANQYGKDEWVTVRGKLTVSNYKENEIITLEATRIERIEEPESPYVYPDLDFGL